LHRQRTQRGWWFDGGPCECTLQCTRPSTQLHLTPSTQPHPTQAALAKLRGDYESSQSQLFDTLTRLDEAHGAVHSTDDAATLDDELDRLRRQVAGLSQQRDTLQQQLEQMRAQQEEQKQQQQERRPANGEAAEAAGEAELAMGLLSPRSAAISAVRDSERLQLRSELEAAAARVWEAEHQARLLQSRLEIAEAQSSRLQTEVQGRPSAQQHSETRAALAALSALLGRQLEQEGWEPNAAQAAVVALTADPNGLQAQLQERVTKLKEALDAAQQQIESLKHQRDAALDAAKASEGQLSEAKALLQQLETDLLALGGAAAAGGAGTAELDRLSSAAAAAPGTTGDEQQLLASIITRQRDRYQQRVVELEQQCSQLEGRVSALTMQSERFQRENVGLVEKIRYLQQHRQQQQAAGASSSTVIRVDSAGVAVQQQAEVKAARLNCGPFELAAGRRRQQQQQPTTRQQQSGLPTGSAEAAYLDGLNPFSDFRKGEAASRVRSMPLHDRVVFAAGSLIAGSAAARAGVVLYIVLLHLYIFIILSARSSSSSSGVLAPGCNV